MNKIYKVVWSKVRNAYVVVSELAKRNSKTKSQHTARVSHSLLSLAVLTSLAVGGTLLNPMSVEAANSWGGRTNFDNNTTSVGGVGVATADGKGAVAVGNATASGEDALALGKDASATGIEAIAIGGATATGTNTIAIGNGSTASGTNAAAIAGGTAANDYAIAIGLGSIAGTAGGTNNKSVAIGYNAIGYSVNDVVIGPNQTAITANYGPSEDTPDGTGLSSAFGGRVMIGHDNIAYGRAGNSVILGSNNRSNAVHGIAIGQNAYAGQPDGSTLAYENTMSIGTNTRSYSTDTIAIGNNAVAGNTDTSKTSSDGNGLAAVALGSAAKSTTFHTVALGADTQATGSSAVAVGDGSVATAASTIAVGNGAKATRTESIAIGPNATTNHIQSIAIGKNTVTNGQQSVALGDGAQTNGLTSIAIGRNASSGAATNTADLSVSGRYTIAIGDGANAVVENGVALGRAAKASAEGSVAIGRGSTATRAADTNSSGWSAQDGTWSSYLSTKGNAGTTSGSVWNSTSGVVSIGIDGASATSNAVYTRKLTGLAAGQYDTDAVNMAQWTNTMLATTGDVKDSSYTTTYGSDGTPRTATKLLNESLKITGGGSSLTASDLTSDANIGTVISNNTVTVRLAKNLTGLQTVSLTNPTTGNSTVVSGDGITITPASGDPVSLTNDGLDNGNKTITNVAAGVNDTDAVNVKQLEDRIGGITGGSGTATNITVEGGTAAGTNGNYAGDNLQVTTTTATDGSKTYDMKLADNLNLGEAGTDGVDGSVTVNGKDGSSVAVNGADGSITAKGTDGSAVAINGADGSIGLTGSNGTTTTIKGGTSANDVNGNAVDRITVGNQTVATLNDGMVYTGDTGSAAVKLNKTVNIVGGETDSSKLSTDNNIGIVAAQDGDNGKLTVRLAKDITGLNTVTAGDALSLIHI